MSIRGSRRQGTPVVLSPDGSITKLRRHSFTQKDFDEAWLQELIRTNPGLLPIGEIEPAFAPLVSIGREVSTDVGPIDNMYLSPQGYLTIVEAKLWRNPEARRQVVGQIIDYAKEISRWSFSDLDGRVLAYSKKYCGSESGVIATLRAFEPVEESEEAQLIDTISLNLKRGRFLLLVVGDGIGESVEEMADFLSQAPQLQFTLALVELQVYDLETSDGRSRLVLPQVVARTNEVTRAVVHVEGASEGVRVDVPHVLNVSECETIGMLLLP